MATSKLPIYSTPGIKKKGSASQTQTMYILYFNTKTLRYKKKRKEETGTTMNPSKPPQIRVLVLLKLLHDVFVFRLAVEPKHEGYPKRWQCHDGKSKPVSHMW